MGEEIGPNQGFTLERLEDDEDGFGTRGAAGKPAQDRLPPVCRSGTVSARAIAEPDDRIGEIGAATQSELACGTSRDGESILGGDIPACPAETVEGVVDGVPIVGGVDDLNHDGLTADAVDAFENAGAAEDVALEIGQREVASGEAGTGDGQAVETVGGVRDLDELPEQGDGDGDPEEDPKESAAHGVAWRGLGEMRDQRRGNEARLVATMRPAMMAVLGRPWPAQEKAGIQAMAEANQRACCQDHPPRAATAKASPR